MSRPSSTSEARAQIRPANRGDTEALVSLWLELIEHHQRLDPNYTRLPNLRETLRQEVRRGLGSADCEFLVGIACGEPIGFVFAEVSPRAGGPPASSSAWIHELYVEPERRRRGLATALVDGVQPFLGRHGDPQLHVRVESGNREGAAFWRERGFSEQALILARTR